MIALFLTVLLFTLLNGTALHDPMQHCTIASQKNINQFVFCACAYAYANRMQTTYLCYRKRLRRICLYICFKRLISSSFMPGLASIVTPIMWRC